MACRWLPKEAAASRGDCSPHSETELLDQLVGALHDNLGQGEAECPRSPEVQDHLELGRSLDRQVRGTRALQYLGDHPPQLTYVSEKAGP